MNEVVIKKADKTRNKIIIPRRFIEKYGYEFYMVIHEKKIELIPTSTQQ